MTAPERVACVAGRFYPGTAEAIDAAVRHHLGDTSAAGPIDVLVGPHAGWIYSGEIAGRTWARARVPPRVVLLAPNHTGMGAARSLWGGGAWVAPGMRVEIDQELRDAIARHADVECDVDAHVREHAIEVHLPFMAALNPRARIVPLVLSRMDAPACARLGAALARALAHAGGDVLVVASTDMSHYVPADVAARLDALALERVVALDPDGLHRTVEQHRISMCGYVPTTVALHYARARAATRAELVQYGHSGTTSGDLQRVVGYAGAVVHRASSQ